MTTHTRLPAPATISSTHCYTLDSDPDSPPLLLELPLPLITGFKRLYHPYQPHVAIHASPTDYADTLSHELNLPTRIVRLALNVKYELTQSPTTHPQGNKAAKATDSQFILRFFAKMATPTTANTTPNTDPAPSNGYSPIVCHCHSCGATFKLLRSAPPAPDLGGPVYYCVFCGHPHPTVGTISNEETAYDVLAEHYHLPPSTIKALYNAWSSRPTSYASFKSFMAYALPIMAAANTPQTAGVNNG